MIAVVFVTVIAVSSEEDRAMDTGNVYKNSVKFGHVVLEVFGLNRQANRDRQACRSQYFVHIPGAK